MQGSEDEDAKLEPSPWIHWLLAFSRLPLSFAVALRPPLPSDVSRAAPLSNRSLTQPPPQGNPPVLCTSAHSVGAVLCLYILNFRKRQSVHFLKKKASETQKELLDTRSDSLLGKYQTSPKRNTSDAKGSQQQYCRLNLASAP